MEAGREKLVQRVVGVQTDAFSVIVEAGSVLVEALAVIVVGLHDDLIAEEVELSAK